MVERATHENLPVPPYTTGAWRGVPMNTLRLSTIFANKSPHPSDTMPKAIRSALSASRRTALSQPNEEGEGK